MVTAVRNHKALAPATEAVWAAWRIVDAEHQSSHKHLAILGTISTSAGCLLGAILVLSVLPRPVAAELASHALASGPGVEVALIPENPFPSAAGPVIAVLDIHNRQPRVLTLDLGHQCRQNIRLSVTRSDESKLDLEIPRIPGSGLSVDCIVQVQPGETYSQKLLLNSWLAAWPVGTHHVTASLEGWLEATTLIEVLPRDPARLSKACESLAGAATSRPVTEALLASEALSLVSDPVCLPAFVQVLKAKYSDKSGAVRSLARLGTAEAVAALVESWAMLDLVEQSRARYELIQQGRVSLLEDALAKAGLSGSSPRQ